jgi:8-oxo-dGTP pyrophosphatase MutT (NUDIX family)
MRQIADFAPDDVEAGVGLALQDAHARYLFFLAGTRHRDCPPGTLFYAGIGGHREPGEEWLACAHREAREEIDAEIRIFPAPVTWYVPQGQPVQPLDILDQPRPLAFYEMIHPPRTPRAGGLYRLMIYRAELLSPPGQLAPDEVRAVIALTAEQVLRGPEHQPTLAELLDQGAEIIAECDLVDRQTRLYPQGTACALAAVLRCGGETGL